MKKLLFIPMFASVLLFSGCGEKEEIPYLVDLEIWGTFDSSDAFSEIIRAYKDVNPNAGRIEYRKIAQDTYKKELLDAMASGNGPDIFIINNSWLPSFESKMTPIPNNLLEVNRIKENFVDTVQRDFVKDGQLFALPLSVDSLALYYNKTLFNVAGITAPPRTWQEFNDYVKRLTRFDEAGNIVQSGASLGTSKNVNRFSDIIAMLMMQNKAEMTNASRTLTTMGNEISVQGAVVNPGKNALSYYTQFADRNSALYTWNDEMHYSLDAFSEGKLGMMINYSYHADTIRKKDAKLSFDVAPVPQYDEYNQLTYANYWAFGVSNNKKIKPSGNSKKPAGDENARVHEAWQFLKYLTMNNAGSMKLQHAYSKMTMTVPLALDPAAKYIEKTGKPAARRDLIEKQKGDPFMGIFAKGNLIATSWYQKDTDAVENIFSNVVDQIVRSGTDPEQALSWGVSRINETMR